MMSKYERYILYAVVLLLVCGMIYFAVFSGRRGNQGETPTIDTVSVVLSDTVYVDTLFVEKPVPRKVYVKDTVYVEKPSGEDTLFFEVKNYSGDDFSAWVSGYNPSLDSISVYPKTREVVVSNTVTRTEYKERNRWYIVANFDYSQNKEIMPSIGATYTLKSGWLFGASVGYGSGGVFGGVSVGYRIK